MQGRTPASDNTLTMQDWPGHSSKSTVMLNFHDTCTNNYSLLQAAEKTLSIPFLCCRPHSPHLPGGGVAGKDVGIGIVLPAQK